MNNLVHNFPLTSEEITFTYVVITGILLHILKIPDVFASFLALPSLLIIPYLAGETILKMLRMFPRVDMLSSIFDGLANTIPPSSASAYTISWMLGSHVTATILLILTLLHLSDFVKFFPIILSSLIGLNLAYKRHKAFRTYFIRQPRNSAKLFSFAIVVVAIAATGIGITKFFSLFRPLWEDVTFYFLGRCKMRTEL